MKRNFLFWSVCTGFLLILTQLVVLADGEYLTKEQFSQCIKTCTPGRYANGVDFFNTGIGFIQKVMGPVNGKCRYVTETYPENDTPYGMICDFNEQELAAFHKTFSSNSNEFSISIGDNNSYYVRCDKYDLENNQWKKRDIPMTMVIPKN